MDSSSMAKRFNQPEGQGVADNGVFESNFSMKSVLPIAHGFLGPYSEFWAADDV